MFCGQFYEFILDRMHVTCNNKMYVTTEKYNKYLIYMLKIYVKVN